MSSDQRLLQIGRLEEMRKREQHLKITIDGAVRNIQELFSAMDAAMDYAGKIDIERLVALVKRPFEPCSNSPLDFHDHIPDIGGGRKKPLSELLP